MMLLSTTTAFSQEDMQLNDSLVYTPAYLMEMLMADLDQCDKDRIELKKAKAELAVIYIDLAKQTTTISALKNDLNAIRSERDTLEAQNMKMAIDNTNAMKKVRKSRNRWFTTALLSIGAAVGIHYDWKNGWTDKFR